jgi:ornithine cyclodeaminase/alanine dehydrogenase-like protein (mu-crystallin family)
VFPQNPVAHALPTISAMVFVIDPDTGRVAALLDATHITALRTGAVTGLATDLLARRQVGTLAVYGAGVQARAQVEAVRSVRSFRRILVWSPRTDRAASLVAEIAASPQDGTKVEVGRSPDELVEQADVIVAATTSSVPVFDGSRLQPGTHVNAIGSFKPTVREVDDATVIRARIFVDHRASAMKEAGDLLIPMASGLIPDTAIQGDLADLVLDRVRGRTSDAEITLFKPVGLAAEDLAIAGRVLDKAAQIPSPRWRGEGIG